MVSLPKGNREEVTATEKFGLLCYMVGFQIIEEIEMHKFEVKW